MSDRLTIDDLEYVKFVASEFCNGSDGADGTYSELASNHAIDLFRSRINLIKCAKNHKIYSSVELLNDALTKYKIDRDKYWYLLLFLTDFTNTSFGEFYEFEEETIKDKIEKLERMLPSPQGYFTVTTEKESVKISIPLITSEFSFFIKLLSRNKDHYITSLSKRINCDNNTYHKINFFIKMLDYFLKNYGEIDYKAQKKGRKDWRLIGISLIITELLDTKEYNLDLLHHWLLLRGIGAHLKNMTKNCPKSFPADRSSYYYVPYEDI